MTPELAAQTRCMRDLAAGAAGRGFAKLHATGPALADARAAAELLKPLHPVEGALTAGQRAQLASDVEDTTPLELDTDGVSWALRTASRNAAPGPSGWRTEHLAALAGDAAGLAWLTGFFNKAFLAGEFTPLLRALWCTCNTIALSKPVPPCAPPRCPPTRAAAQRRAPRPTRRPHRL